MFATSSSDATAMAWNWVIQSIAKFKQVDSSTLAGLVDKAPEISVDLGKDAKEMVSLRILESLFLNGNDATVDFDPGQTAKISFDPSEHCEDNMHKILEETSEPMTELERRKWNIHPFIIQKNASLPKTPVQKLAALFDQQFKEALIDGNHLVLESLKELSKLEVAKVSENTILEVDDLVFLKTKNENSKLQKSPLQKPDHLKDSNIGFTEDIGRKEHDMTIEPPVNDLADDNDDNVDHGQQLPCGEDDDDLVFLKNEYENSKLRECPLQKQDHLEDSNIGITEDIGKKEREMTIEPPENSLVDDNVDHGQQLPRGEDDDDDLVFLKNENENSKLQESPLQKPDHVEDSNIGFTEDIRRNQHEMTIEPLENDLGDNANVDHGQQSPGENDDEMSNILAKKEAFLSSQFTQSQDFISSVDFTEIYLCMKCNKGGQLLVCNSDACPFRVHERCLGSAATFDENKVFFCLFCSYSHAISKYMEVKKKASFARKDFQAFFTSGLKHKPNISSKTGENIKLNVNEHSMRREKDCAPVDSLHRSTHQAGKAKQPSEDKESPVASTSSHSKRARKQEPRFTSTTIILQGRRNLLWEKSEKEKLKEGMKRFSNEDNKRIPWKKILDSGWDVFDKSRTT